MENQILDRTFFDDALSMFACDVEVYFQTGRKIDDLGYQHAIFEHVSCSGSLQTDGRSISRNKKGNVVTETFSFYCKDTVKIAINDIINYNDQWLIVKSHHLYPQWGVMSLTLEATDLSVNKDLQEFLRTLEALKNV